MHNGNIDLQKRLELIHPNQEFLLEDLAPGGRHALPGFVITDNPQSLSIISPDPNRTMMFGPVSEAGVALRVVERAGGLYVRGIDLIVAIGRLLEVGPPVWQRSLFVLADWWKKEIAGCQPFLVPEAPPQGRAEMEAHVDTCGVCQPVSQAMVASINAGSSAYRDEDVREMIERAHADPAAAVEFYERRRAAQGMVPTTTSTPSGKPRRKEAEQVTA